MGSPSAVAAQQLSVQKGRLSILKELSFSLAEGSLTGLLGPSGAGKTTLMRIIVGVQKITGGKVSVLGQQAGSAKLRGRIGYVSQAASVYRDLSVLDNVRYFGRLLGANRTAVLNALEDVGLAQLRQRRAGSLSGGELGRVSLACALLGNPSLLVMDEPTVGLDPLLRAQLWEHFRSLSNRGCTLLISSHVMEEASHCDSLLLLRQGELLSQLTPEQLRENGKSEDLELAFLQLIKTHQEES
ncbi:multidrug ABC transporter ATPase [Psychromicrobium lacuslunae]|uniref:Multidrug ABC transporter ATPase n=1 Tax=Psychromicrobium lacuslunae TaxID=1618207 RepID=A0A0D4C305_9MICC|nr:multidrug ABC transporter ATPase [Psychromicrobium lacuslunae]